MRAYRLQVFNWTTSRLLLTGIVANGIAHNGAIDLFYHTVMTVHGMALHPTGLAILAMLTPLAFVMGLSFGIDKLSITAVHTLCGLFAAQQQVRASRRPLHLIALGKTFTDDSIHRGADQA